MTDAFNNEPLVSIILPSYNVAQYISEAIASLEIQSYKNIEIIVVDDGSTDDTRLKAEKALDKANCKTALIAQPNQGVSVARNVGISASQGDFIICVDPDDLLHFRAIEFMVSFALKHSLNVVASSYQRINTDISTLNIQGHYSSSILTQEQALHSFLLRDRNIASPAMLISRKLFEVVRYRENIQFTEDVVFVWEIIASIKKLGYLEAPMYGYRCRPCSTMTGSSAEKIIKGARDVLEFFNSLDVPLKNKDWLYARWLLAAIHTAAETLNRIEYQSVYEQTNAREVLTSLRDFPQFKTRLLIVVTNCNAAMLRLAFRGYSKMRHA